MKTYFLREQFEKSILGNVNFEVVVSELYFLREQFFSNAFFGGATFRNIFFGKPILKRHFLEEQFQKCIL